MYCVKCGKVIADNAKFCPACGAPVQIIASTNASVEAPVAQPTREQVQILPPSPASEYASNENGAALPVDPYARANSVISGIQNPLEAPASPAYNPANPNPSVRFEGDLEAEYLARVEGVPFAPNPREAAQIASSCVDPSSSRNQFNDAVVGVRDYFILNLISTFCCCLPIGAVGAFFSLRTMSAKSRGDVDSALKNANAAAFCFWCAMTIAACFAVAWCAEVALQALVDGLAVK